MAAHPPRWPSPPRLWEEGAEDVGGVRWVGVGGEGAKCRAGEREGSEEEERNDNVCLLLVCVGADEIHMYGCC